MMTATAPGVRCGNRQAHGDDRVYHRDSAAVRACYSAPAAPPPPPPRDENENPRQWPVDWAAIRQIPVGGRGFGYYAVEGAEGLRFYRVERPKRGKHAGKTFVKVQASDDFHKMPFPVAVKVMETIAADPEIAGKRYAAEINSCSRCGRTLTDETSRAQGMGPECVKKGW